MTEQTDGKTCPVCGMEIGADGYELHDGVVCKSCVKFLRFTIPVTYILIPVKSAGPPE